MSQEATIDKEAPRCPVETECGACQLLHIPYDQQLKNKQEEIKVLFSDLVDKRSISHPILGMEDPYHYRNKVVSPFVPGKKISSKGKAPRHEILCGMYAARSHRVISTDACLIENETAKQIVHAIRDLMLPFKFEPYRESTGTGFLRHVVIRVGHASGEVLVTLVTNKKLFPRSKDFSRALIKRCPSITSIVQNVNTRQTNVILGEEEQVLYGPGFILDTLCDLSFRISSTSFYQVNVAQTEVLYRRAIEMAHLSGTEILVDAYCGTGTIGIVAARGFEDGAHALRVIGVDEVKSAIRDARLNAKHNKVTNAEFVVGDAGRFMKELAAKDQGFEGDTEDSAVDVVLLDPPRAGASEDFLQALVSLMPSRVVYISCNPQTQARDVGYLVKRGYRVEQIQPVDMFPHTKHIEVVVSLSKTP